MLFFVDWHIVNDVSADRAAFIFRVKKSKKNTQELFEVRDPEDEGSTLIRNVGNYLLIDSS
jgi:hypothetical protein